MRTLGTVMLTIAVVTPELKMRAIAALIGMILFYVKDNYIE